MSNPNASPTAARWIPCLGALALLGGGIFLTVNFAPVAGGADSSGYLNSARLLARGRLTTTVRIVPEFAPLAAPHHQQPLGFQSQAGANRLVPIYPVGLPLHQAAAALLAGWEAGPVLVGVGGALLALVLCYLVARELELSPPLALAGAAVLGLFTVFIFSSTQPLSDTLATMWCLAAVFAALRSAGQQRSADWAVACGAAAAFAVLVRPTNALLLPALAVLLGSWRNLLAASLGGLPGAIGLGLYNHALHGAAWQSGYVGYTGNFHPSYFWPTLAHFTRWLALLLPPVLLVLPLALLRELRTRRRELAALALWFGVFTVFYACYEVSHENWWCLRFILPAVPALILGGLLGLESLCRSLPGLRGPQGVAVAAAVLVLWAAAISAHWTRELNVLALKQQETAYPDACVWARAHLPRNAVVAAMAASGALYYYTDFPVLRWDQIPTPDFHNCAAALRRSGRPLYALLFSVEQDDALKVRMPVRWEKLAEVHGVGIWVMPAATP